MESKPSTRNATKDIIDIKELCQPVPAFNKYKLPTLADVMGAVKHQVNILGVKHTDAYAEVSNKLYFHWVNRNIYCIAQQTINKKLSKTYEHYRYLCWVHPDKQGDKFHAQVADLVEKSKKLFDIFCEDVAQRQKLETKYGICMQLDDHQYLESMRSDRTFSCNTVKDYNFHSQQKTTLAKTTRRIERQNSSFSTVHVDTITHDIYVEENGNEESLNQSADPDYSESHAPSCSSTPTTRSSKKRSTFVDNTPDQISKKVLRSSNSCTEESESKTENKDTQNPVYVRGSNGHVLDHIYLAMAVLDGMNFSYREMIIALRTIGNICFGAEWNYPAEFNPNKNEADDNVDGEDVDCAIEGSQGNVNSYDRNTLPTKKSMRVALKKVEASSLKLVANEIMKAKEDNEAVICHATDSTTRKGVGSFSASGIHINKDVCLPLPSLPLATETTDNIADQIDTEFKILAATTEYLDASDIYQNTDVHMTDSTAHNKGIASSLAEKFDRDTPAGQLFCDSHTTLGFDRSISSVVHKIEEAMGMKNIFSGFLVDVQIDQKQDTVSLSAVAWFLNLFGPDHLQKPWNYNKDFLTFLSRRNRKSHLIQLKDARFGYLSKCCAVVCYHWEDFADFLDSHEYITNKLACLVRDALNLSYIKIIVTVIATLGLQLVEPFHARTIDVNATHSSLKEAFSELHTSLLNLDVSPSFFRFDRPELGFVSQALFDKTKLVYKPDVVASVQTYATHYLNDCVTLAQKFLPGLADTLARQRGKFYNFGDYPKEYDVFEQITGNIDLTPVNNLEMERKCGDIDNRLKKKGTLNCVSRGSVLKGTEGLIDRNILPDFHKMGPVVRAIEEIKTEWSQRQKDLSAAGLNNKEAQLLAKEAKKLDTLEFLRGVGGPFTTSDEVDTYLSGNDAADVKSKRMRMEVTYARDTSVSFPQKHAVFRIFNTSVKPRRLLTPIAFGDNLKIYLGKRTGRTFITIDEYRVAVNAI